MKAYIISENDIELLRHRIEMAEGNIRQHHPEASAENTPAGEAIRKLHYAVYTWLAEVTR